MFQSWYNSFWLWRWLLHRLSKHQSLSTTTVLFRTTFTQTLILNQLTFCSIYILCWRWDLQDAVCIWFKISSDKINFCLAGKNNLSYIIIVRTVPDLDLEIRERGRSSRPLENGGGDSLQKIFVGSLRLMTVWSENRGGGPLLWIHHWL